jgi:hypothetical protein
MPDHDSIAIICCLRYSPFFREAALITRLFFVLALVLSIAVAAGAEPATRPVKLDKASPAELVALLGDANPATRDAAAWRLREIGRGALPALREAADSPDPEVQRQVKAAIHALDRHPLPAGGPYKGYTILYANEERCGVIYHEGLRNVRIEQDVTPAGSGYKNITMTISGLMDGKQTKQTITAADEKQLKWDAPAAWKIFHKYNNPKGDAAAVRVIHSTLDDAIKAAMKKQNLPGGKRKLVLARLQHYTDVASEALRADMFYPQQAPARMAAELAESDSLRKFLAEMGLPIVGDFEGDLEPLPASRLGIDYLSDRKDLPSGAPDGLLVQYPATGERGARIGLKPLDVIVRIDGKPIQSGDDLRTACEASQHDMVIEVFRDGDMVTLHEK